MQRIVFSDVDGTLLNSQLQITELTLKAIKKLQGEGIEFVICTGRSPAAIKPIMEEYAIKCPLIAYGGALISDINGKILYHKGIPVLSAEKIMQFIDSNSLDASWCIYSYDEWFVKEKNERIVREEKIVKVKAEIGDIRSVTAKEVSKLMCICNPQKTEEIEKILQKAFPEFSIFKSSAALIEIMAQGINKSSAIKEFCNLKGVPLNNTVAFGDGFNDVDMLNTVGISFLMGNAPMKLKEKFARQTLDNDSDGIYYGLKYCGLI